MDFMNWILQEGWKRSDEIKNLLCSPAFRYYVETLELPVGGNILTPAMRLVWKFNRPANARFDLSSTKSIADFIRWYRRSGEHLYSGFETDAAGAALGSGSPAAV